MAVSGYKLFKVSTPIFVCLRKNWIVLLNSLSSFCCFIDNSDYDYDYDYDYEVDYVPWDYDEDYDYYIYEPGLQFSITVILTQRFPRANATTIKTKNLLKILAMNALNLCKIYG